MEFGKRLSEAMARKGYRARGGVQKFASMIPVKPNSVSRWIGGGVPGKVELAKAAELLEVTPEWLLNGEGETSQPDTRMVRETLLEPDTSNYGIPPISIPSDPAQRMARDHVWAKYTARIAQMRHEGAPLDHTEVQEWLDEMHRAAKEDAENVRLSFQKPQNGKQG